MANEIITEIILDLDKLKAKLKEAESSSQASGKKAGQALGDAVEDGATKGLGKLKTAILAVGSALAAAFSTKLLIDAASRQQDAVNDLNVALAASGNFSREASQRFQDFAASLQANSTVADEVILKNASVLASLGRLSGQGLERATKAAVDLSAGMGIDVGTAFDIVAKAANGNVGSLNRLGLQIRTTGSEADILASALGKIEARFGGAAQSKIATFSGAVAQFRNVFGDSLEVLGDFIIKSPVIIELVQLASKAVTQATKSFKDFAGNRDVIGDLTRGMVEFGQSVVTFVVAPLELLFNFATAGFQSLRFIIQTFILIVAGAFLKLAELAAPFSSAMASARDVAQDIVASTSATLEQFAEETSGSFNKIFDFNSTAAAENFLTKVNETIELVRGPLKESVGSVVNAAVEPVPTAASVISTAFNEAFAQTTLKSEKFRAELTSKLTSAFNAFKLGIANSFASIGAALVKGENAFAAFGKALLGVFGDLAIQLGTFYFLLGLANLFLNPAAAAAEIAGGLALIVLGGALKALAGGGGAAAAPAAAGGGVAAGAGGIEAPAVDTGQSLQEREREQPRTNIEVNVQGNILDRRESGLAIAEIIQETFSSNGLVFATAR